MRSTFPLLAAVSASILSVASLWSTASMAQDSAAWMERDPQSTFPISPPEAPHRHSSTALEGYLRGLGVLTRAQADYMIAEGQAGILWEQIYAMRMENFLKKAKTHFEWKELMAAERHQKWMNDKIRKEEKYLARAWSESRKEMREAAENPLSEFDVDFQTGMIYWPSMVASPRYAQYRQEIEQLTADILTGSGYTTIADRERLKQVCQDLRQQLRKDLDSELKSIPSVQAELSSVERLIKGLRYTPVVMAQASAGTISMN